MSVEVQPARRVFTYLTGQYDNVGDVVLRRAMVERLSDLGIWHIYVGSAPDDYVRSLGLPKSAYIYRSSTRWSARAAASLISTRQTTLLVNPGEISSTKAEFVTGTLAAALLLLAKLSRNQGLRIGVGARDRRRPLSLPHELATVLATRNVWRDQVSRDLFARGEVAPDWAFALAPVSAVEHRNVIALSYRGDKELPSPEILRAITEWAQRQGLEPVVVTQVARDFESNQNIADRLAIRHITPASDSLIDTETAVRRVYSRAAIVLSNRIHVLILAAVDGASPGAILGHADIKIERTLKAGHIDTPVLSPAARVDSVDNYLDRVLHASQGVQFSVKRAAEDLQTLAGGLLNHG